MRRLLLILSVLLLWVGPVQAATLLTETFEGSEADLSTSWPSDSYGGFCCTTGGNFQTAQYQPFFLDTTVSYAGSKSMRFNYVGTQYDADGWRRSGGAASKNYTPADDIWITFYRRLEAGFQMAGAGSVANAVATKGLYMYAHSATKCVNGTIDTGVPCADPGATFQENGWVFHNFYGSRRMSLSAQGIKDAVSSSGASTPYGTQNFHQNAGSYNEPDGVWSCFEARLKWNTPGLADGIVQLYAQNMTSGGPNILVINVQNREFRDSTPTGRMPSDSRWDKQKLYRQDGRGQMWYDNITISTTRIGCGGGGTIDTTPPGTTTGLTAPATSATSTQLAWTQATDTGGSGIKGTVILRSVGAGVTPTQVLSTILTPTATYLDQSLTASTTYNYRVQGIDNAWNLGPVSATVSYTTAAAGSGSITFDAVANSVTNNTAAALPAFSHTTGAGANRLLSVCTQSRGSLANVPVASVLSGATPLTLVRGDTRNDGGGIYFRTELWRLIAPASGAANVAVTFTGTLSYGVATSISLAGVDQTTPVEVSTGSSGLSVGLAATLTTLTSDAWIQDCAIGRADTPSGFVTVGSGQVARTNRQTTVSNDAVGVSTVNGKTPAGSETMDWTQGASGDWVLTAMAIKPAVSGGATPAPAIDTITRTPTTLTVTYGANSPTLPTFIRLAEGDNAGRSTTSVVHARTAPPFDSATATTAIFTLALLPGADYSCVYAQAAGNVENQNPNDVKCVNVTGLVPIDTAAPILSNLKANGNVTAPQLPNGATSFTLSLNVNKTVPCRYDTVTRATYADFPSANGMSVSSLTASVAIASGVPAYPATQAYFVMCQFTDAGEITRDSTVSSLTVSAAAPAGDTTAPAAVNVTSATALSQSQATAVWNATTDNVAVTGYTPVCSFGTGNVTYVPCANETLLTTTLINLPQNTVVNIGVLANDAAGNVSLISNIRTITTTALPDLNLPSSMSSLTAYTFKESALLIWPPGSDTEGSVTTQIEQCSQVSAPTECTDFAFKQENIALSVVSLTLAPSTSYCWRGRFVDGAGNVSPNWSPVVCGITKASGILMPRTPLPFGVQRLPRQ